MPLDPPAQFAYWMILFAAWIGVPLWTLVSLALAAWKPRSRAVWVLWSVLLLLNVPGVFVAGHWLLWTWFPALERHGTNPLTTAIIFGVPILSVLGTRELFLTLRSRRS